MKKNKLIELAFEIEKLKIRDTYSKYPTDEEIFRDIYSKYPSDKEIELEQDIFNRFENEKQNPYFDDDSNINYSGLRKLI